MTSAQPPHHDNGLPDGEHSDTGTAPRDRVADRRPREERQLGGALAHRLPAWLYEAGAQPAITFFDVFDGQRTELSRSTLTNWTAKVGNLLQFDLPDHGAADGDVRLRTAGHWAAVPTALAAWRLGRSVVTADAADTPAPLTVAFEDNAGPDDLVVGAALGGYLTDAHAGRRSFTTEVLAEPDDLDAEAPAPDAVALIGGAPKGTGPGAAPGAAPGADVTLSDAAAALGADEGSWLLLAPVDSAAGLVAVAAAVLTGAHLVMAQTTTVPDPDLLQRIIDIEKVSVVLTPRPTAQAGQPGPAVPVVALPDW